MPNQYVNKVVQSDGTTLIDLTEDTVTSSDHIMQGYIGHLADGSQVIGTGSGGVDGDEIAYGGYTPAIVGSAIVGTATTWTAFADSAVVGTDRI